MYKRTIAALVAISFILAACGDDGDGGTASPSPDETAAPADGSAGGLPEEIVIGSPLDTSGSAAVAPVGIDERDGASLAVKEINESNFLGDAQIVLDEVDTGAEQQQAIEAVLGFVSDDVDAVVGFTLTPSFLAAAPELQDAGIPTVAVGLSAPGVTEIGDHMFRVYPDMAAVIPPADLEFAEAFGGDSVAYLYQSDMESAAGIHAARKAALEEAGYNTVAEHTFTGQDIDLRAQLTAIDGANPDIVVVSPIVGMMAPIYLQAAEVGIDVPIISLPEVNETILEEAGPEAQCVVYTTLWHRESEEGNNQHFLEYFDEHGPDTDPTVYHVVGYTSVWAMAHAFKAAGTVDQAAVRDALATMDGFDTPLGQIDFREERAASIGGTKIQVQDSTPIVWDSNTSCEK